MTAFGYRVAIEHALRESRERSVAEDMAALRPQLEAGIRYLNRPMTDADRSVQHEPYMDADDFDLLAERNRHES